MKRKFDIIKGLVALLAFGFVVVGCEKEEFEPAGQDDVSTVIKGDQSFDGDDPDPNGSDDPTGAGGSGSTSGKGKSDSLLLDISVGGAIVNEGPTPFIPNPRMKDDRIRDGANNEDEDDGEDDGGRHSSLQEN